MPKKTGNQQKPAAQSDREGLTKLGMTEAELEIWYALAYVAGKMLRLPTLHPMEQEEVAHDIHKIQNRLLARPGLRAAGWPRKKPEPSS